MKRNRISLGLLTGFVVVLIIAALVFSSGLFGGTRTIASEDEPIFDIPTTPTPTIAPPPTDAPVVAGKQLLEDTFASEGTLVRWEAVEKALIPENKASWIVKDGQLVQNGAADGINRNTNPAMLVAGDPRWTDYTISAKVYDANNATFGLIARRQGDSFYRFRINAERFPDTPKLVLEKVIDGEATALYTSDGPGYEQRMWHTIAMTVRGTNIQVTLDGEVVAEATDDALARGQAGVYTRALGNIVFDDITVVAQ